MHLYAHIHLRTQAQTQAHTLAHAQDLDQGQNVGTHMSVAHMRARTHKNISTYARKHARTYTQDMGCEAVESWKARAIKCTCTCAYKQAPIHNYEIILG